jgi:hypothetical protein
VGRLENIVARNQGKGRSREKVVFQIALAAIVLVLILLAVFTDLGRPPVPPPSSRVDGVLLGAPRAAGSAAR